MKKFNLFLYFNFIFIYIFNSQNISSSSSLNNSFNSIQSPQLSSSNSNSNTISNVYIRPEPRWKLITNYHWNQTPSDILPKKFSQRELCILNSNPSWTSKSNLSLRQFCQFKPVTSEIRSKIKVHLHGKKDGSDLDATAKSNLLKKLPQCDIGFIKYGFWVETSRRQIPQCIIRGTNDRSGYLKYWSDLPVKSEDAAIDLAHSLTKIHEITNFQSKIKLTQNFDENNNIGSDNNLSNSNNNNNNNSSVNKNSNNDSDNIEPIITNLIFLGDSVSTQLAQFLICDLARSGVYSSDTQSLLVKGFIPSISEFHLYPQTHSYLHSTYSSPSVLSNPSSSLLSSSLSSRRILTTTSSTSSSSLSSHTLLTPDGIPQSSFKKKQYSKLGGKNKFNSKTNNKDSIFVDRKNIFRIHSVQFNLPCIHSFPTGCETSASSKNLTYHYTTTLLENYTSHLLDKNERIIIILNYGLHLRLKHSYWAIPGMMKAYLDYGKKYKYLKNIDGVPRLTLLYRETTSQVFTSNNFGTYEWNKANTSIHPQEFCCNFPLDDPHIVDWRNARVITELNKLDKNWNNMIGWIPFFNDSLALYDMRVEFHRVKHIDCTHFIYSPTAYSSLWYSIQQIATILLYNQTQIL